MSFQCEAADSDSIASHLLLIQRVYKHSSLPKLTETFINTLRKNRGQFTSKYKIYYYSFYPKNQKRRAFISKVGALSIKWLLHNDWERKEGKMWLFKQNCNYL